MVVTSVQRDISAIKKSAEKMEAAQPAAIGTASVGDVVRQGDLYLVCLDHLPEAAERVGKKLAPGETQGSRHVASGECAVYRPASATTVAQLIGAVCRGANIPEQLVGPLVECLGETTIEHPEHGHRILPAGTVWAVVYQRAYGEEVRRVQD